jgi:broad specificity phosphatase PhoE
MSRLILVKHSLPAIVPHSRPATWRLNDEGRRRAVVLAERIVTLSPDRIVASREPKASETAEIVARRLSLPWEVVAGLHEHERDAEPFTSQTAFDARIAMFLRHPDALVYGRETADEAHQRFAAAIRRVLEACIDQTPVVVCHGTVIVLFVSRVAGVDPFPLWQRLGLPSYVVLSLPNFDVESIVNEVDASS